MNRGRPPIENPKEETIIFRVTAAQKALVEKWGDLAEYLRKCLDHRDAIDQALGATDWEIVQREYIRGEMWKQPREEQLGWLTGRYNMTFEKATEFLAYVGDGRGSN